MPRDADANRPERSKVVRFALLLIAVAVIFGAIPFALGLRELAKYFVTFALLAFCLGCSCLVLSVTEHLFRNNGTRLLIVSLLAATGLVRPTMAQAAAIDNIAATLPLDGYYRPGELMPVRIVAANLGNTAPIVLSADGAVPTEIQTVNALADGVFPWLVCTDQPRNPRIAFSTENKLLDLSLKPLRPDDRLVAVTTSQPPDTAWLQSLFPGKNVIAVRIALTDLLKGPTRGWGALDALILDDASVPKLQIDGAGKPDIDLWDQRIPRWRLAGISIVVRGATELPPGTPWEKINNVNDYIARGSKAGPEGYVSAEAYRLIAGWTPRRSSEFRRQLFLRAVGFVIIALAFVLWKPAAAPYTLTLVSAIFGMAVFFWESRTPSGEILLGEIITRHRVGGQRDHWGWTGAIKPIDRASATPVFASLAHAQSLNARLVCGASMDGFVHFQYRLEKGQVIVGISQEFVDRVPVDGPLRPPTPPLEWLAKGEYLGLPGARIEGEIVASDPKPDLAPDTWNAIVVDHSTTQ